MDQPKIFLNELDTLLKKPFDFVVATTLLAVEAEVLAATFAGAAAGIGVELEVEVVVTGLG